MLAIECPYQDESDENVFTTVGVQLLARAAGAGPPPAEHGYCSSVGGRGVPLRKVQDMVPFHMMTTLAPDDQGCPR